MMMHGLANLKGGRISA